MRRGRSTQVSVFDPESSGNRFSAEFKLTGDGGSPYEFGIRFSVDGDYFALGVTCSCAVLVLADMPERLSGRLNRGLDV